MKKMLCQTGRRTDASPDKRKGKKKKTERNKKQQQQFQENGMILRPERKIINASNVSNSNASSNSRYGSSNILEQTSNLLAKPMLQERNSSTDGVNSLEFPNHRDPC